MSKAQCPQISGTLLISWDSHWLSESIHPASKMCLISSQQVAQADMNPAGSHLIKNSWSHPVSNILPMTWKSNSHRKFWYLHRLRWKCRPQSYFDLSLQRSLVLFLNRDELSEFSSPEINMRKSFPLSMKVYPIYIMGYFSPKSTQVNEFISASFLIDLFAKSSEVYCSSRVHCFASVLRIWQELVMRILLAAAFIQLIEQERLAWILNPWIIS